MLELVTLDGFAASSAVRSMRVTGPAGPLEVLHAPAAGPRTGQPLLFVHGAYTAAWVWAEHFLPWFAARGFDGFALSLRGHGESAGAEGLDGASLADYVADLGAVVEVVGGPVTLVGHSMGGMVVQSYLRTGQAHAAVLMASVPPWGLGPSCAELAWRQPSLLAESMLAPHAGPAGVSGETIGAALFSDHLDDRLRRRYLARAERESRRVMLDMLGLDLPWRFGPPSVPMLVLGAARDGFFAPHVVRATALAYSAATTIFPQMAHTMMLEPEWEHAAQAIADWPAVATAPQA